MNILNRWWGRNDDPVPHCERCRPFRQSLKMKGSTQQLLLSFAFEDLNPSCSVCTLLYQLIVTHSDPRATTLQDKYELWGNRVTLSANGLEFRQALYFQLKLLTVCREIWMVPNEMSPPRYVFGLTKPDDSRLIRTARDWIRECESLHHEACKHRTRKDPMSLKVIDCTTRKLRVLPANCPYVCLSYVWGISKSQDTSQVDLQNLPRTMEDTIHVTILLGMQYLWVDRYCIDQTNDAEKHHAINHMDVIYEGAAVTIIAAAGDGPHAGLPGIRGTPRIQQYEMTIEEKQHTIFANPRLEILKTTWSSRGWTYQEMVLSRRRLVFTQSQIYFQCNQMHCGELITTEFSKVIGSTGSVRAFPRLQTAYADEYIFECLQEYYSRRLSYQSDIIKAFMGVIGAFCLSRRGRNLRASQFYGIPLLYFDADEPGKEYPVPNDLAMPRITFLTGLAWSILGTEQWSLRTERDDSFPSWTWASVKSNRDKQDCGNLVFPARSHQESSAYGKDTRIYIHHRSEGRKELFGLSDQWSEHELYHPWIDIESWATTSVLIPEPGIGPRSTPINYRLSGFKGGQVVFDYGVQTQTTTIVTVVLLGGFHLYADPGVAILLVLEEVSTGLYRRVGLYSSVKHERGYTIDCLCKLITPRFIVENGQVEFETEQNKMTSTSNHSVQSECTWRHRIVRLI